MYALLSSRGWYMACIYLLLWPLFGSWRCFCPFWFGTYLCAPIVCVSVGRSVPKSPLSLVYYNCSVCWGRPFGSALNWPFVRARLSYDSFAVRYICLFVSLHVPFGLPTAIWGNLGLTSCRWLALSLCSCNTPLVGARVWYCLGFDKVVVGFFHKCALFGAD